MSFTRRSFALCTLVVLTLVAVTAVQAAVVPESGRFDHLVVHDPISRMGKIAETPAQLPDFDAERVGWAAFRQAHGDRWQVWIDRRSGTPMLVQGRGIRWFGLGETAPPRSPFELEALARKFIGDNRVLFKVDPAQLVLSAEGSGQFDDDHWLLLFNRVVDGIPVEEQRFRLYVTYGKLVAFGADRWGALDSAPEARLDARAARDALYSYMALTSADVIEEADAPRLALIAAPSAGEQGRRFTGSPGDGQRFHLVWRLGVRIAGEPGTWIGKVDAVSGDVLAFYDDDKYNSVAKGGVFPVAPDGSCPDGCEQPDWPMPWADIDIDGVPSFANDAGLFDCSPSGGTATTTLTGQYMNIFDRCGAISESAVCEDDIDLGISGGNDCTVPAGASAGDTHAARTCFYHGNRVKEKARHWLPGNTWLGNVLTCDVNINNNCNAVWSGGEINFYTSGGGCNNTGEIGGVIHHEWGHGMDFNDGGGGDNPSEAYADVAAIIQERRSCVGRGFRPGVNCSGYGDTCLNCTGIRDMDWDQRISHTPATPTSFVDPNCGGGGGPCGREVHCESYPPSEAIFDLAARDLPAAGLDSQSSWQLAERLFWSSRQGSGGDVYNCTIPNSDGCGAGTWFTQMRTADDDDGDLSNGTPHAAAIFAAFDRHGMACGAASDPENQSTSSCPTLAAPALTGTAGSNSANLTWTDVPGAAEYNVLRTEVSCDEYSFNVIDEVAAPTLNYVDDALANDLAVHFRVQAEAANPACTGAVSNCVTVTPQPFAGSIRLDRPVYGCDVLVNITVRDANTGSTTVDVTIFSDSEPTPETVTLTETAPGSARFEGSIQGTSGASTTGDGLLALTQGDSITARYIDADDGMGGSNLTRETSASADCAGPSISGVAESGVTDSQATITWTTNEASTSKVNWGESTPPANEEFDPALTASHSISLSGLQSCTVYFYSVESEDEPGNLALDDNFGAYYSFETLGDFGQGLQPCHDGQLTVQAPVVSCTDSMPIQVIDIDLNNDTFNAETVQVTLTSTSETTAELLTLTETGPNTSIFTGTIAIAPAPAVNGDGILQAADGDLLTATYQDADNGLGVAEAEFDTGVADCAGAGFVSVEAFNITDETAGIQWVTDETTTGEVQWGLTPALGNSVFSNVPPGSTSHSVSIGPLLECGRVYFRVIATDRYGNVSISDAGGVPYELNAYEIPGAIFKDGFEGSTGWSLDGEWEIDPPQGLGASPGDPTSAFADSTVLGHDLSGQGLQQGNYEPATTEYATSPAIDASSLTNGELKFRRWLNVAPGAISEVQVDTGSGWSAVWSSDTAGVTESGWSLQTIDVSAYADGNGSFRVRFRQFGGFQAGSSDAGWNVDRFILRDGGQPPWGTCGGCGGAPTFAGVTSAVDLDPCADTGVRLSWEPVPGWGTGDGGTFVVYRDTVPGFIPSAANTIASGVTGTSYDDLSAPNDTTHYYVVRAENNETCDIGPNNNGVLDPNTVEVAASDETSQTLPGDVGATLLADNVNDAHVRLSWAAVLDAATYHVYRAEDPQGPFTQIGDVAGTFFEDANEIPVPTARYYRVVAADACGNEGP